MNKKKNTNKGITLIALIITVIVLLILAGVAIGIAINGGDIFGKASQAREEWNISVEKENTIIHDVLGYFNNINTEVTPNSHNDEDEWVDTYGGLATQQEEERCKSLFTYEITSEENKEAKVAGIDWEYVDENTTTVAEQTALLKKLVIPHQIRLNSSGEYLLNGGENYSIVEMNTLTLRISEFLPDFTELPKESQAKYASGSSFGNSRIAEEETSLIIPATIKRIKNWASFSAGTLPRNKIIFAPNSQLETIDQSALEGIRHLETIVLPEGLTTIREDALSYCYSLRQIYIPVSVTTIENYAMFYGDAYKLYDSQKDECPSEEVNEEDMNKYHVTFYYEGTPEQWQNISPEKWEWDYNLSLGGFRDLASLDASDLTTVKFNQTPETMANDTNYVHLWKD